MNNINNVLILADGNYYLGKSFGANAPTVSEFYETPQSIGLGEVLFNTSMTGYVEVITDPSFSGQLVCMTYPHIGNYGVDKAWTESGLGSAKAGAMVSGFIVHTLYKGPVPEGRMTLHNWLLQENVPGITGIDTRALTCHIRDYGEQNAVIVQIPEETLIDENEFSDVVQKISQKLKTLPTMEGRDIASEVGQVQSCKYEDKSIVIEDIVKTNTQTLRVAVFDCGCKQNIVRLLAQRACEVHLISQNTSADDILKQNFDMLLVSNGPGDPAVLDNQIACIKKLVGKIVLCGICLGNQLLALALGAKTYKMSFGHHGANHPVKDVFTNKLYVTSQNHGFAVDEASLPEGSKAWFINTNDSTLEGFICENKLTYSVQFHPEAAPGPADAQWVIDYFLEKTKKHKEQV